MDPATGRFVSVDPLAEKYYSVSPYAYCANNPVKYVDPDGKAWELTYDEDQEGERRYNGYRWVAEENSYDSDGNLKSGLYVQAIFFSDNGTFDSNSNYNIGSSTATVYKADGTIETFDASTLPSDQDIYATVPEGIYHATVGTHSGSVSSYTALRMSDTNDSGRIELGMPNPSDPRRTYAQGINIHKPGINNFTGIDSNGNAISQGCLLIDRNNWSDFIDIFDNDTQRLNKVSITVSRNLTAPANTYRRYRQF